MARSFRNQYRVVLSSPNTSIAVGSWWQKLHAVQSNWVISTRRQQNKFVWCNTFWRKSLLKLAFLFTFPVTRTIIITFLYWQLKKAHCCLHLLTQIVSIGKYLVNGHFYISAFSSFLLYGVDEVTFHCTILNIPKHSFWRLVCRKPSWLCLSGFCFNDWSLIQDRWVGL